MHKFYAPVLGVNLHPGEEWTTLDDWATGVSSWAVASSTADSEAFKIWANFSEVDDKNWN